MTKPKPDASFERIVEWAYSTLPEKIRTLPDFPGIQVADEPSDEIFEKMSKRRNWPRGTELLGCYSGISRTKRQHNSLQTAPDLIFVFQGPILRCSRGNLPAEVKQVVWHEVAHWLGHDEAEVKDLGLSIAFDDLVHDPLKNEVPIVVSQESFPEVLAKEEEPSEHPRCVKCYSADVTCHEVDKPLSYAGANLLDPVTVHAKDCRCNSCGHEWGDEDTY